MEALGRYVVSVTASAMICAVVMSLGGSGGKKALLQLICGLLLAVTVLRPVAQVNLEALLEIPGTFTQGAQGAAQSGEKMAREAMVDIIKSETEAYILDKAAGLNAAIAVEVSMEEEGTPVPVGATLSGEASPYARKRLEQILQTELGIPKENQRWTG